MANELDNAEGRRMQSDAAFRASAIDDLSGSHDRDHRLQVYRTQAGQFVCHARSGALVSETFVTAAVCGADEGCHGTWRCLTSH